MRGLRVWLAVKLHGLQRFREHLKHKMDLAMWAAEALERVPNVTVVRGCVYVCCCNGSYSVVTLPPPVL